MASHRDSFHILARDHVPNPLWKFSVLTQVVCMTLAATLFLLRSYVRLGFSNLPRQWILEDWMVTFSFLGLLAFSINIGILVYNHGGVHIEHLTTDQAHYIIWHFWLTTIVYGPVILATKLSILLLYRRLLVPRRHSRLWWSIYGLAGVCAAYYTINTFIRIWSCNPMEKSWNGEIPGRCLDALLNIQISGVINTITDLGILLVPIVASWNLQLEWRKKLGIVAVLTIGAIAPVVSAVGAAVRYKATTSKDVTYIYPRLLLCVVAEITIGVTCVCLPLIPPLFRKPRTIDPAKLNSDPLSSRPQGSEPFESALRPSTERSQRLSNTRPFTELGQPPQPSAGFNRTRPSMQARQELNMLKKENRETASDDGRNDMLDFLAEAGRIDDPTGNGSGIGIMNEVFRWESKEVSGDRRGYLGMVGVSLHAWNCFQERSPASWIGG